MEEQTTHPVMVMKEHIAAKIQATNINNPRANASRVMMKGNPEYADKLVPSLMTAVTILTQRFASGKTGGDYGKAKLTEASLSIGSLVAHYYMPGMTTTAFHHLNLGDYFIGTLREFGFVEIAIEDGYTEFSKDSPYVVTVLPKFSELTTLPPEASQDLIKGSTTTPIKPIESMVQANGRPVIKDYDQRHIADLKEGIEDESPWIQGVNRMQSQGWMMNLGVLRILEDKFESMKTVPPARPMLGSKKAVDDALDLLKAKGGNTEANRQAYNTAVELWNNEVVVLKALSKNMEIDVIKAKAQVLSTMGVFYQFVECDYRGRAYYYEPIMNYQGPDIARGLFQFAEGKLLDDSGVYWLAIHTACSYNKSYGIDEIPEWCEGQYKEMLEDQGLEAISVDKMSLRDRAMWTFDNLEWISNNRELMDCEKPVVFLACCLEWEGYLKDPENFLSHLPVAIDGTCNGYQHNAAISRDEDTARLVGMVKQDIPEDLYVRAAQELVRRNPEFFEDRPEMTMKHIRKGVSKRACMTRQYSAGKDKIAKSMYSDCHTEEYTTKFNIDMMDCIKLSSEMYELIKDVCPGATKTMEFLQDLVTFQIGVFETYDPEGNKIGRTKKKSVHKQKQDLKKKLRKDTATDEDLIKLNEVSQEIDSWETRRVRGNGSRNLNWWTPSGFHVHYDCYIENDEKIRTTIPGFKQVRHAIKVKTNFPHVSGYQSGISPNFIHGEDAAHMMNIISSWEGSFAGVHDSFSTHASDVQALVDLTRERFVEMYDLDNPFQDIVDRLLDGEETYDRDLPELGTLDIQEVKDSDYFFA